MDSAELVNIDGRELAKLIATKMLSPVEVMAGYIERITRLNPNLNAYITVCHEEAMAAAKEAERQVMGKESLGPLHGLPLSVKDQFDTAGVLTTSGSTILERYIPKDDATSIARAKEAGAILLGKLNMTEFAAGMGDPYKYGDGPARNPWNLKHSAGTSSSGSGIAIAASLCSISLGEDTGGSIRGPASFNGIVGLRPTWGRVSRHGLFPFSWSLDTGGPMTRSVEDAAMLMSVIAGFDPKDPQTSRLPVPPYLDRLGDGLKGVRIGIIEQFMDQTSTNVEILKAVNVAAAQMGELGALVEPVSLPILEDLGSAAAMISESDGATVHQNWLKSRPADYGQNIRRRLLAASLTPSLALQKAMRIRAILRKEWLSLFQKVDILISPTSPSVAEEIAYVDGVNTREEANRRFGGGKSATFPAAMAGTPAMSIPCGFNSDKLPIGLQIMGSHFREDLVLRVGYKYEQNTTWHTRRPPEPSP